MFRLFNFFRALVVIATFSLLMISGVAYSKSVNANMAPESGVFRVGVEPWLGYGQWYVAEKNNIFKENGLDNVKIVNFSEDKDIHAALASGHLDAASLNVHAALKMRNLGIPVHIVMMMDQSLQADGVIANGTIGSLKDIKGKQVAFEQGTTSEFLLRSALNSVGLKYGDIIPVHMPAASAGSALIAGRIPVAVTYEPYLSIAMKKDSSAHMLYDAADDPGLISDVLVVRDSVIKKHPGQVLAMIKSWNQALDFYNKHTKEGRSIIAHAIGSNPLELEDAFNGVQYYGLSDNKKMFKDDSMFIQKTYDEITQTGLASHFIKQPIPAGKIIDARFVNAISDDSSD